MNPDPEPDLDLLVRGTEYGSTDPYPHQNATDPQHCLLSLFTLCSRYSLPVHADGRRFVAPDKTTAKLDLIILYILCVGSVSGQYIETVLKILLKNGIETIFMLENLKFFKNCVNKSSVNFKTNIGIHNRKCTKQ